MSDKCPKCGAAEVGFADGWTTYTCGAKSYFNGDFIDPSMPALESCSRHQLAQAAELRALLQRIRFDIAKEPLALQFFAPDILDDLRRLAAIVAAKNKDAPDGKAKTTEAV